MLGAGGKCLDSVNAEECLGLSLGIVSLLIVLAHLLFFFFVPQLRQCAQLTNSAVNQDAVSVCPGVVMGKMTALTTAMRRTVRTQVWPAPLLLIANVSILEVTGSKVSFVLLHQVQPRVSIFPKEWDLWAVLCACKQVQVCVLKLT